MGEVYRAHDPRLKRDVALKVLPAELASEPERLGRFQREAETLAALNHPHIVTIFSVEEAEEHRFLTMELIDGRSLDQLFESGVTEVFARVARQALETYVIEHRFFHLDHFHGRKLNLGAPVGCQALYQRLAADALTGHDGIGRSHR